MAFSSEQRRNAAVIVQVGRQLGASQRDIVIALMAALVESRLINVNYGDRDSLGLFQQRAAWAPRSVRMDPAQSARMFFLGGRAGQPGLFDKRNRGSMGLGQAAQAVQVSAFPGRYAAYEDEARALIGMGPGKGGGSLGGKQGGSLSGGSWTRPVRGGRMTQEFGRRNSGYAAGHHTGMDYGVSMNTPVYAAAGGKVVSVTRGGAYGLRIEIEHGGKLWTLYAHLNSASVRVGQTVTPGMLIGKSGNSGNSEGPHLHFEVRRGANAYGNTVDPMQYLNGSTTPAAYVEGPMNQSFESTVPMSTTDLLLGQQKTMQAMQSLQKPYMYLNPIDMMTAPNIPIGTNPIVDNMTVGEDTSEEPRQSAVTSPDLSGSPLQPEMV